MAVPFFFGGWAIQQLTRRNPKEGRFACNLNSFESILSPSRDECMYPLLFGKEEFSFSFRSSLIFDYYIEIGCVIFALQCDTSFQEQGLLLFSNLD